MKALQIFNSSEFGEIRTITINNEPWFVGRDIAEKLGYSNPRDAIMNHVFEEDKGVEKLDTLGGPQDTVVINEAGVYGLIFGSKLESAKQFKHWVFSEVLPSLRKTGTYTMPELRILENKASLFDRLSGGHENKNFRDSAKALDITQSQLIGWLKNNKMIYKNETDETLPTPEFENSGFFKIQSFTNLNSYYKGRRTLITPIGLAAFANMLDAAGYNRDNMPKYGGRKGGNPGWNKSQKVQQ